jgi:spermidine synthase
MLQSTKATLIRRDTPATRTPWLLWIAVFLSGLNSLIFELIWSRYLTLIFGASALAVASVLTCFMLGMAGGSWYVGRRIDKSENSFQTLILLNVIIGLYGLASPFIFSGLDHLNSLLFSNLALADPLKNSVRFLLSFVVLLGPTFSMGGTFPVVIKLVTQKIETVAQNTSHVYWINTLGGALGAFVTGFILIRFLGLSRTLLVASLISLVAAGLVFLYSRTLGSPVNETAKVKGREKERENKISSLPKHPERSPAQPERQPKESGAQSKDAIPNHNSVRETPPSTAPRKKRGAPLRVLPLYPDKVKVVLLAAFALSGFTSLAYEVFFTRILTLFFRDSVYDFAIVLTTFLLGLTLGSLICGRLITRSQNPLLAFAVVESLIGLAAILCLSLIAQLPYVASFLQSMPAFQERYGDGYWTVATLIKFGYAFLILLFPTSLLGATFPLVSKLYVHDLRQLGKDLGLMTGANTLGSTLGPLLAGFLFIPWLGTQQSILSMALLNVGIAVILVSLSSFSDIKIKSGVLIAIVLGTSLTLFLTPPWDKLRMSTYILEPAQPVEELLSLDYYHEDAYGLISVAEVIPLHTKVLSTNRLFAQSTSVMLGPEDHRRLGYLPLMLHPQPQTVLVIGLGAGITLRGVTEYPGLQAIDCVEISSGVRDAAAYFSEENANILENHKVNFIIEDGRNFIRTSRQKYDVIISDIFFPVSSGSSALFSREHFAASQAHLNPGGLMVQWLAVHQLSLEEIKIITKTFQSVFPHTSLWYGMLGHDTPVIGLVGTDQKLALDLNALEKIYDKPDFAQNLQEVNLDDPYFFLSNFILEGETVSHWTREQALNTDDHPLIEFTNPTLADDFQIRGQENLLHLNALTEDILPYLKLTDTASLNVVKAKLEGAKAEVQEIILN